MKLSSPLAALFVFLSAAAVASGSTVTLGDPLLLSELVGGDSLIVGDKIFADFGYAATGDMPTSGAVNVIPIIDDDENYGLRFQGGFLDLPGGGSSDALVTFSVAVIPNSGMYIHDVHIVANPDLLNNLPGLASINETFLPEFPDTRLSVFDNGTDAQLVDWTDLPEWVGPGLRVEKLKVQKDILLRAADDSIAATISFVDQTFSQIPEPSAGLLGLLGLTGLFVSRRRSA